MECSDLVGFLINCPTNFFNSHLGRRLQLQATQATLEKLMEENEALLARVNGQPAGEPRVGDGEMGRSARAQLPDPAGTPPRARQEESEDGIESEESARPRPKGYSFWAWVAGADLAE